MHVLTFQWLHDHLMFAVMNNATSIETQIHYYHSSEWSTRYSLEVQTQAPPGIWIWLQSSPQYPSAQTH